MKNTFIQGIPLSYIQKDFHKWDVRVYANGTLHLIGLFNKLSEAKKAASEAASKLHGKPVIRYIDKICKE